MLRLDDNGNDVRTLQESLRMLGYRPGKLDGDFGEKTEAAVIQFQEAEGIYADGIVGPVTQSVLEDALKEFILEQQSPGPDSLVPQERERLPFVRVDADVYRDGYDRFFLREDVAHAYERVRERVTEAGGRLTSSGGRRLLSARVSPSRSVTSFHYTGRALDLHVGSGMESPARDPYVVARDDDRFWRVYVRADGGVAMEVEACTYRSRNRSRVTEGRFLDLTTEMENEGFKPIRARRSFDLGGHWLGAEWWHFQYEKGLKAKKTTFGDELLRVYPEETIRGTPPWNYRSRIYGLNWS
jgi:hypothetical protein